jgi:hypothetical protein
MIFDNITVMIFPGFATAPVCKKQFIRLKNTEHFDMTIGELYQKCAADIVEYYSAHGLSIVTSYRLLDARAIMESRPDDIWLRHKKSLESFLRLMQQLIMMVEYRPEPTLDNPLMILLLMMHAGVIIAVWEGEKNYALGKNLNTFTSKHDNTNMESYTSVTGEDIVAWELLQVFYPNVEYHVIEKEINVCHLYVCKSAPSLHFFRSLHILKPIFRGQTSRPCKPSRTSIIKVQSGGVSRIFWGIGEAV